MRRPQRLQGAAAGPVGSLNEIVPSLHLVYRTSTDAGLLRSGVVIEAFLPGFDDRLRLRSSATPGTVPGQSEAGLLTDPVEALSGAHGPLGQRLVLEQSALYLQRPDQLVVSVHAGLGSETATQTLRLEFPIHLERCGRVGPDMCAVGLEQTGTRPAEWRKSSARCGKCPTERPAGDGRPQVREQRLSAASRLTRRPGLTSTSWQRRLAGGRAHGPAVASPRETEKRPSRFTRSGRSSGHRGPPARSGTVTFCHASLADSSRPPTRFACWPEMCGPPCLSRSGGTCRLPSKTPLTYHRGSFPAKQTKIGTSIEADKRMSLAESSAVMKTPGRNENSWCGGPVARVALGGATTVRSYSRSVLRSICNRSAAGISALRSRLQFLPSSHQSNVSH